MTRARNDGGVLRPPPPPTCPPGWRLGPPDFVGVGGQRCGTTRWYGLLRQHPEVAATNPAKELHYFDRFYASGFSTSDGEAYHRYFPSDGTSRTGEWTPLYMAAPWIPRLLAEAAPKARLLALLRDPVERYVSGLQHDIRIAGRQGLALSQLAPLEAFARGLYSQQLTRLLAYFERSQVLVLQYERCTKEPEAELQRTFEFIGVDDVDFVPDLGDHPNRQSSKPKLDPSIREALVAAYRDDVLELAGSFPEIDLRLWPNFADLAG